MGLKEFTCLNVEVMRRIWKREVSYIIAEFVMWLTRRPVIFYYIEITRNLTAGIACRAFMIVKGFRFIKPAEILIVFVGDYTVGNALFWKQGQC